VVKIVTATDLPNVIKLFQRGNVGHEKMRPTWLAADFVKAFSPRWHEEHEVFTLLIKEPPIISF